MSPIGNEPCVRMRSRATSLIYSYYNSTTTTTTTATAATTSSSSTTTTTATTIVIVIIIIIIVLTSQGESADGHDSRSKRASQRYISEGI